jgi:hypothetical protein
MEGKIFSHLGWEELVQRGERDGGDDFPKKGGNLINGWWALCGVVKCQVVVVERGRQVWSMREAFFFFSFFQTFSSITHS